jgi:uncharacterized damage-inducible protein DinB
VPTSPTDRLLDTLRRSYDGEAWHGPALAEALAGLDARDAVRRPIANAHSPWELLLHVTAWTHEVTRRLHGAAPALPPAGDWPAVPDLTGAERTRAWSEARTALDTARGALLTAVAAFDPARLDERLPPTASDDQDSDAALGVRHTFHGMLVGLAEHNAYHGGQLVLLRRAIDG